MIGAGMATQRKTDVSRMLRAARKAEGDAIDALHARIRRGEIERERDNAPLDPGTGQTVIKRQDTPIARLIHSKKIGPIELQAVEDIRRAYASMCSALWFKPLSMEKTDRSSSNAEPARIRDAVARYKIWAGVWSDRAKRGDPSLALTVGALWDEWSFTALEEDYGLRHGTAAKAVAACLRDYAARAGWATGRASRNWLVSEGAVFRLREI